MTDYSHLHALELHLSNDRARLAVARSDKDRAFRARCIAGWEREIVAERRFLGLPDAVDCDLTDDELLAALGVAA